MSPRTLLLVALAAGCGYHTRHPGMHFVEDILSANSAAIAPRGPAFDLGERTGLQFSECLPYVGTAHGPDAPRTVDVCYLVAELPTSGRLESELAAEGWVVWLWFGTEAWVSRGDHPLLRQVLTANGLFGSFARDDGFTYRRTRDPGRTFEESEWFCERRREQVCTDYGYWKSFLDPLPPREPERVDHGGPG